MALIKDNNEKNEKENLKRDRRWIKEEEGIRIKGVKQKWGSCLENFQERSNIQGFSTTFPKSYGYEETKGTGTVRKKRTWEVKKRIQKN